MGLRSHESPDELLHHDRYSPEELADLLEISLYTIQRAVYNGHLKAYMADHHIVDIHRKDVLNWLHVWRGDLSRQPPA